MNANHEELERWIHDVIISKALLKIYASWEETDKTLHIPPVYGDYEQAQFFGTDKERATWLVERDKRDKTAETFMGMYGMDEGKYVYLTALLGMHILDGTIKKPKDAAEAEETRRLLMTNYIHGDPESAFNTYGWILRGKAEDMKRYLETGTVVLTELGKKEGILRYSDRRLTTPKRSSGFPGLLMINSLSSLVFLLTDRTLKKYTCRSVP